MDEQKEQVTDVVDGAMAESRGATDPEAVGAAIRKQAETVAAPERLRMAVARSQAETAPRPRRSRAFGFAIAASGALAALVLVFVLAQTGGLTSGGEQQVNEVASVAPLPSGEAFGPSPHQKAVQVALVPATGPVPGRSPENDRNLDAEVGGVYFPGYAHGTEWEVLGLREGDEVDGRDAATVDFGDNNTRVGYTIVDSPFIEPPAGARQVTREGIDFAVSEWGDLTVVTWERNGRTCILASRDADLDEMLGFASWEIT